MRGIVPSSFQLGGVIATAALLLAACDDPGTQPRDNPPDEVPDDPPGTEDGTPTVGGCTPSANVLINEISTENHGVLTDADGDTVDWIELANASQGAVSLAGWSLTDDGQDLRKWVFPEASIPAGALLVVYASGKDRAADGELHASFSIDEDGERILLTDEGGCVADALEPEDMGADHSYGRTPDGDLGYFLEPTPGEPNTTESRPGFSPEPTFDPLPGPTAPGARITMSADGAEIRYALGGELPDGGQTYDQPIPLGDGPDGVAIRAIAEADGLWPSRMVTATFIPGDPGPLPKISLVTEPANLFDPATGIYTNWEGDGEVPVRFEMWESDGTPATAVDGGLAIHGGATRVFEQKAFLVKMRGSYGDDEIPYPLFPDQDIEAYDRVLLRAAGNDWLGCFADGCSNGAYLRDALVHRLGEVTEIDTMAYRPAEVWLDGVYWGVYDMREKPDDAYVKDHHGEEDIDLLEMGGTPLDGDREHWDETMRFLRSNDLNDPVHWAEVERRIDVASLADYLAWEVFFDNRDWPGNNIKYWRPRAEDGKWRWLLYDTDWGVGAYHADPAYDTLAFALEPNGPNWPNPPWSTELFRLMLGSDAFRDLFVARYADWLNTRLRPTEMLRHREEIAGAIAPRMDAQVARWGEYEDDSGTRALADGTWERAVDELDEWIRARPGPARQHVMANLGLSGTWTLDLRSQPAEAGTFRLTAVEVEGPFTGTYFRGVPVVVTAVPAPGHVFVGWDGADVPDRASVTIDPAGDVELVARFE